MKKNFPNDYERTQALGRVRDVLFAAKHGTIGRAPTLDDVDMALHFISELVEELEGTEEYAKEWGEFLLSRVKEAEPEFREFLKTNFKANPSIEDAMDLYDEFIGSATIMAPEQCVNSCMDASKLVEDIYMDVAAKMNIKMTMCDDSEVQPCSCSTPEDC